MAKIYPRVLIVGHAFHNSNGAGITLTNLFRDWPADRLAVIKLNGKDKDLLNYDVCSNYYFLGSDETEVMFPLSIFQRVNRSQIADGNRRPMERAESLISTDRGDHREKSLGERMLKRVLRLSGLDSIKYSYRISDNLHQWIDDFGPDVMYSALGDLDLVRFMLKMTNEFKCKIAIHIWDDWPNTLFQRTLLPGIWGRKFQSEFAQLIERTDIRLSISESMSEQYHRNYNRSFVPFHNPVDLQQWGNCGKILGKTDRERVLYFGKMERDNLKSLKLMAEVIDELNETGRKEIEFVLYSPQFATFRKAFSRYKRVFVKEPLRHDELQLEVRKASILFLPLDFGSKSVQYARLSMPTKSTEYMASGVPTIVLAHPEIALNKYTKEKEWALLVEEFDKKQLSNAVLELLRDDIVRSALTERAQKLARLEHSGPDVREKFRQCLAGECTTHAD